MHEVVVGVDPQQAGQQAIEWALAEAIARGVRLRAVRAWVPSTFGAAVGVVVPAEHVLVARTDAERMAEEMLKLACERVPGADRIETVAEAVPGPAGPVLVDAGGSGALVVVGTRGAGLLSRAVLGSVSSSVVHHSRTAVVVVPERDDPSAEVRRVLVGIDHSPESLAALRFAVAQARRCGATLVPLFVHEPFLYAGTTIDLATLAACERQTMLDLAEAAGAGPQDVQPEVLIGHAAGALRAAARPDDLLVLGSRGRGGFAGLLLGSTSTQLAQHAICPVIIVRADEA